jgi:hypothetical protein
VQERHWAHRALALTIAGRYRARLSRALLLWRANAHLCARHASESAHGRAAERQGARHRIAVGVIKGARVVQRRDEAAQAAEREREHGEALEQQRERERAALGRASAESAGAARAKAVRSLVLSRMRSALAAHQQAMRWALQWWRGWVADEKADHIDRRRVVAGVWHRVQQRLAALVSIAFYTWSTQLLRHKQNLSRRLLWGQVLVQQTFARRRESLGRALQRWRLQAQLREVQTQVGAYFNCNCNPCLRPLPDTIARFLTQQRQLVAAGLPTAD